MNLIRQVQLEDRASLENILRGTKVFTDEEISVAMELIDATIEDPEQKDYMIKVAVSDKGKVEGYYCIGPTPLTRGTYDLYWIAVDANSHGRGIGKYLIKNAEDWVKEKGGHLIIAETSSQPKYENTRNFYLRTNYKELARIKNYYSMGDDLVIYGKYVSHHRD